MLMDQSSQDHTLLGVGPPPVTPGDAVSHQSSRDKRAKRSLGDPDAKEGSAISVKHALLALLSEGPRYGMQLREDFEAATGDVWPLNVGQVYTTCSGGAGWPGRVGRPGDEQPKSYLITARGRAELGEWLHMPPDLAPPPRDELVTKVLLAVRVPGTDVHEVIQAHRRQVVELMQEWARVKEEPAEFDLPLAL